MVPLVTVVVPCFNQGKWLDESLDAISAGLPVIVSESVGATEILHDNMDSVFVDPLNAQQIADKIDKLRCDITEYERIQSGGLSLASDYSWKNAYCQPIFKLPHS